VAVLAIRQGLDRLAHSPLGAGLQGPGQGGQIDHLRVVEELDEASRAHLLRGDLGLEVRPGPARASDVAEMKSDHVLVRPALDENLTGGMEEPFLVELAQSPPTASLLYPRVRDGAGERHQAAA